MRRDRGTQSRPPYVGDDSPRRRVTDTTQEHGIRGPHCKERHPAFSISSHSVCHNSKPTGRIRTNGLVLLVTLLALFVETAQASFIKAPVTEGYIIPNPTLEFPHLSFDFANGTHLSFKLESYKALVSPTSTFKDNGKLQGPIHYDHVYKAGKSAGFVLRDNSVEGFFRLGDKTTWMIKPLYKYCRIREAEDFFPIQCKLPGKEVAGLHFLYPVGHSHHQFFSSNEAMGGLSRVASPLTSTVVKKSKDFCALDTQKGEDILKRRLEKLPAHILGKRAESGCPTRKQALYIGFAMDCTYVERYGSASRARDQVLLNMMQVTEIFDTTFNIQIGVLEIEAFSNCNNEDPTQPAFDRRCASSYTISDRLSDFSQWRGTKDTSSGLWHLMSMCATGSTVGLAWLNTLCETDAYEQTFSDGSREWVSGTAVSTSTTNEYLVVAHEIGHNFGAVHDCASFDTCGRNASCCSCATNTDSDCDCGGEYIMNPTSDIQTATFSPCSQSMVCRKNAFLGTCLQEPGTRTVLSVAVCGNGRLEGDEECDCGGVQGCVGNPCCNSDCTLKPTARCSDGNHACCENCQILPATPTRTCRNSTGECDIAETCNGVDASCPNDTFITDGTLCQDPVGGTCSQGTCTSRKKQCEAQANSESGREVDVITGDCPVYRGQCQLFCESTLFGCRAYQSFFTNGTRCGNNGLCIDDQCTEPDTSESTRILLAEDETRSPETTTQTESSTSSAETFTASTSVGTTRTSTSTTGESTTSAETRTSSASSTVVTETEAIPSPTEDSSGTSRGTSTSVSPPSETNSTNTETTSNARARQVGETLEWLENNAVIAGGLGVVALIAVVVVIFCVCRGGTSWKARLRMARAPAAGPA